MRGFCFGFEFVWGAVLFFGITDAVKAGNCLGRMPKKYFIVFQNHQMLFTLYSFRSFDATDLSYA